jgi:hypothetical protein
VTIVEPESLRSAECDSPETAERFIEELRRARDRDATQDTHAAIETLVANSAPWAWLWVFELVQNALDAGAKRIRVSRSERGVHFEHDGTERLLMKHVEGLCGLGRSTKGLMTVGFMGIGFKSVFHRFRRVAVSAGLWRFGFHIRVHEGYEGARIPEWFDAVRPFWDGAIEPPADGFTTRFDLEDAWIEGEPWLNDLAHLANRDDLTPLAVLGLRRLASAPSELDPEASGQRAVAGHEALTLEIVDDTWTVWHDATAREVRVEGPNASKCRRWLVLRQQYRPNPAALRRFVEVRRSLDRNIANDRRVVEREVLALVPLDEDGIPLRRARGNAYATLPTAEKVPFAMDLQADWFVDLARRGLREIEGDAWQEQILAQVPALIRAYLEWARELPRQRLADALELLARVSDDSSRIAAVLAQEERVSKLRSGLDDLAFVPVLADGVATHTTGSQARTLPRAFDDPFAIAPDLRADTLFGHPVVDASAVGDRAREFFLWMGWCGVLGPGDVLWPAGLEEWWTTRSSDKARDDDLFRLWAALTRASGWESLPSVRTDSGKWVRPGDLRRFNEAPPEDAQLGGAEVRRALGDRLPHPDEVVSGVVRARVHARAPGSDWIARHEKVDTLADAICEAYASIAGEVQRDYAAFFALPVWALSRGAHRHDLVRLVLSESGEALPPREVLLACDGVPAADARRALFPGVPVLDARYLANAPDRPALIAFLAAAGLRGRLDLVERGEHVSDAHTVAQKIGVTGGIGASNSWGYTVLDVDFAGSVALAAALPSAVCAWLELEWPALVGRGRKRARWKNYSEYVVAGKALASWTDRLQSLAWVRCEDGEYRRPTDVLAERTPDHDDAPVATISPELIAALATEGVRWGRDIPKAPALRRLRQPGRRFAADELAVVLDDALAWIEAHPDDRAMLAASLPDVDLEGRPLARWVRTLGPSGTARSRLDDWVGVLPPSLAERLSHVPGYVVSETTTAAMALAFLRHVWDEVASGVEPKRERREFLRPAYRYVVEDTEARAELRRDIPARPDSVFFFAGRDGWVRASEQPVIDDVADERIAAALTPSRPKLRPSHFMDDDSAHLVAIAGMLGLARVSDLAAERLQVVGRAPEPTWGVQLRVLLDLLARSRSQEPLRALRNVIWVEAITLRVGSDVIDLGARIDETTGTLAVVVDRSRWTTDVVPLLVARHRLSQNGVACAMLALASASVGDPSSFVASARRLARELDVDVAGILGLTEDPTLGPTQFAPGSGSGPDDASHDPNAPAATTAPAPASPPAGAAQGSPSGTPTPANGVTPSATESAHDERLPESGDTAGTVEFDGRCFESVEAATAALAPKLDTLGVAAPKPVVPAKPPSDRVARQPADYTLTSGDGRGALSSRSQVVGRLGEIYARRWLREAPGRRVDARIVDVSTTALRAAGAYPKSYVPPDMSISPGCDLLVFEDGDDALPVGYEIKSRGDNGPIEFTWSWRQEQACRRAKDGPPDPYWPLARYRVLVISDLLAPDKDPEVVILEASDCLDGAEATGWVVRAIPAP